VLDHKGEHLSVRGPLNIARPVQGWPVIVQAGASEAGRQLAAETAEVIFAAHSDLASGQRFFADVKGACAKARPFARRHQILPGAFVIVGDSVEKRRPSGRSSTAWFITRAALPRCRSRSAMTSRFDPDAPLPESLRPTPRRAAASASSNWGAGRT